MELLSCCTYGIRFKVHFLTASIRFWEFAKYLRKCFDKTFKFSFNSIIVRISWYMMIYTIRKCFKFFIRQYITGEILNGMFNVHKGFLLIFRHCFPFPKFIQFLKMTFRHYLEFAFRRNVYVVNYTDVKNNI